MITVFRSNFSFSCLSDVTTSYQAFNYETTRTKTSFEPTTRYESRNKVKTTFNSTSFTKNSSTTANINSNNESGENSKNGTDRNTNNEGGDNFNDGSDETIDVTSISTTDNVPTEDPVDCSEVSSNNPSGVYTIYIANQPVDVYCEMTDNGHWTVLYNI